MSRAFCAVMAAFTIHAAFAADEPLTLERAERLALTNQPLLEAQRAGIRAARNRAISARQLPDPMLKAGVTNLPLNGEHPYSLSDDFMTMTGVGLMQEFPRGEKRRLRGQAQALSAAAGEARLAELERRLRRDTALTWLELWLQERAATVLDSMAAEAGRERTAADIAFRAGRAPQSDVLAADVEVELIRDRIRRREQDAAAAREQLARWTDEPVTFPLPEAPPALPEPPALEHLLSRIGRHPVLTEAAVEIQAAENDLALAHAAYKPDWRVEAMYAWRPEFTEMATLQVAIDLPMFRGNRQDRAAAAAADTLTSRQAMHADHIRHLRADAAAAHRTWQESRGRLGRYDSVIVPRAQARAEAALSAYRAGKTELAAVLDARRAALDVSLMRLELEVETLRKLAELRYLDSDGELR